MIPEFQTLPLHVCYKIINMIPWIGILESHKNCIDQLINMRECLEDYRKGRCAFTSLKWKNMTYMDFALHKIRQKKSLR
jgi:hypothetical protein